MVWKHTGDIVPTVTSHQVGEKRVLATSTELGKSITQIANTILRKGEIVKGHIHCTMDEHFFFLEGECIVNVNGDRYPCVKGDYLYIPAEYTHELVAIENTTMLTIGIAL